MVVPKLTDLLTELNNSASKLKLYHQSLMRKEGLELAAQKRRLKDPRVFLFRHWRALDVSHKKLADGLRVLLKENESSLGKEKDRLKKLSPFLRLRQKRQLLYQFNNGLLACTPQSSLVGARGALETRAANLKRSMSDTFANKQRDFGLAKDKLQALSPLTVLARGYGMIEDDTNGRILTSVKQLQKGRRVIIRLQDGTAKAFISEE
jgi:exodeoxyribonuclease VII large subunit